MRVKATQPKTRTRTPRHSPQLRALLSAFCASAIFTGVLLCSFSANAAVDNKAQLKSIQQNIADKEKRVQQQKQQRSKLLTQLQSQEKVIALASRQLRDSQIALDGLRRDIIDLTASIARLEKQQKQQEAILAQQLDAAFRQGQHSALQMVLSGQESLRSERILAYFGYLNRAREKIITALQQTRQQLAEQKATLTHKLQQQKTLLIQHQNQRKRLEEARTERKYTLTKLEASLEKDQAQLVEMRENESRLRDEIAKAEREARARTERETREAEQIRKRQEQARRRGSTYKPTASERNLMSRIGGLGRPAGQDVWPVRGTVIHRFGELLQGELRWKGLVIDAPEGSEVHAIAAGRVLMADWLQGYGLVVVIDHGKGDMSLYGYNQSALVKVGEEVTAGQPIARVGTSGGRGTPSLYFEIRRQGQAVNPLPWLGK
ncbi:Septal ring factor EnvC, activator of murein hydrolases AmiA and AmiB [Izhakiella capsodis]|uniref:Septal ring factor EnvC, activator of murein hydrolases AmiA and AmiB n=1 Tax=Izhakiella capsodis TaxID=1367852 RepID=A0A1I5AA95_9GAMM|nr:murein hydrolase activator EnvC [Izhakiella capsodis]SFN59372.1 Septal ring factor EnvC, activator of murein hydrolases AmiA and AmiB [Izhakiella capsodis]